MNVESVSIAGGVPLQKPVVADEVATLRKEKEEVPSEKAQQVQPEELMNQIKALTEEGLYSVRFENDERSQELVVKIVDRESDEVIRQVPAEEILQLRAKLDDLVGNIVDTQS